MFTMFKTVFLISAIVLSNSNLISSNGFDYYWREYTGTIPVDAVIAGEDINGQNVYIGQAYIKNEGLMVVQINPGEKEVAAPIKGVKKVDKYIKILCGPLQHYFAWLSVNSSNLHLALLNNHAVIGGHEDGRGQINIGKISYEGGTKIGKINAFNVGNANFRFVGINNTEPGAKSYQVLVFTNTYITIQ